jgi:predicted nucleic acid-binding protein
MEVRAVRNVGGLAAARADIGLGAGETSAIFLAGELAADLVLIDESKARRYAHQQGLVVIGCIGVLEDSYERGHIGDLRGAYRQLIDQKTRIDPQTLQRSLAKFKLRPL